MSKNEDSSKVQKPSPEKSSIVGSKKEEKEGSVESPEWKLINKSNDLSMYRDKNLDFLKPSNFYRPDIIAIS